MIDLASSSDFATHNDSVKIGHGKYPSRKDIPPPHERLIFALDVPSYESAMALIEELGDSVHFYKLGLELFVAVGYHNLVRELKKRGKRVFVDMKFFDVPRTVGAAVKEMKSLNVDFLTVHGNEDILREAVKYKNGSLKILAVTVLTSFDSKDVADMFPEVGHVEESIVEKLVLSRARRALEAGCDGVISSGLEASALRREHGDSIIIVSPGIRPFENVEIDDQKRIATVEVAFQNGADYIVVGRPIKNAPSPKREAEEIQARIRKIFS